MKKKNIVLNKNEIGRIINRMSMEILEYFHNIDSDLLFVGIKTRGIGIAKRLIENLYNMEKKVIKLEELDITLYRDDLTEHNITPIVMPKLFNQRFDKKKIVIVDDVLYTGRTVRAAIEAIIKNGRPDLIQLAVLIDRGHKQLPINANYIGKFIATSKKEIIKVNLEEYDNIENVEIHLNRNKF